MKQLSLFDNVVEPGTWLQNHGRQLTFDEIAARIGRLIVMDMSTQSHEWFKAVLVEKIIPYEGKRRLIYYDGKRQRGLVCESYFDWGHEKAYEMPDEPIKEE